MQSVSGNHITLMGYYDSGVGSRGWSRFELDLSSDKRTLSGEMFSFTGRKTTEVFSRQ